MTEQEAYDRGFHGLPDEAKLRAMSYIDLCDMFVAQKPGTVAYLVLEAEKKRRDQPPDPWYRKPIGIIGVSASTALVTLLLTYLAKGWFNIP